MVLNRLATTLDSSNTDILIGLVIDLDNSLVASKDSNKTTAKDTKMTNKTVSLDSENTDLNNMGSKKYMRLNKAAKGQKATAINQDKNLR